MKCISIITQTTDKNRIYETSEGKYHSSLNHHVQNIIAVKLNQTNFTTKLKLQNNSW